MQLQAVHSEERRRQRRKLPPLLLRVPHPRSGRGPLHPHLQVRRQPHPSFEGEPEKVALPEEAEELATRLWENLNEDNKVSLFVRAIDLATGETEDVIINKYDAVCDEE